MTAKPKSARFPSASGEDQLLARIRRALSDPGRTRLRLGLGDDAAILRARAGFETVLTCDWFLEGTHFLRDRQPPDSIGWKCLARAVSDLAAMGAEPRCFLLSLALPAPASGVWLDGFLRGLRAASRRLNCPAAGGDTTRREQVLVNTTVVGECLRGRAVLRSGARPGDALFVTGRLGEAEFGLRLMENRKHRAAPGDRRTRKQLYPQPRLAIGAWLARRRLATAMMDLSDGLSSDLPRLCAASGVGARLEAQKIPRPALLRSPVERHRALELALDGGDDYELLFAVAPGNVPRLPRRIAGTTITEIGRLVRQKEILLLTEDRKEIPLAKKGWDPFRG